MDKKVPPTTANGHPRPVICFGPYELDLRSAELRRGGLKIRLQDQPFQILVTLLERPGEVVLREEIRQKLWPDNTVVEFDHSINAAIKRLRDALRESADKPRYIETLPRRGYRFIGEIKADLTERPELPAVQPEAVAPQGETKAVTRINSTRLWISLAAGAVLLIALALLGAWYRQRMVPARWARQVALPEAARLVNAGNYAATFPILYRALHILPQNPALNKIWREISFPVSVITSPPGAGVYVKPYSNPDAEWIFVGQSPVQKFLMPQGYYRWRIVKPGYRIVEGGAGFQKPAFEFLLDREGSGPTDMVHIPPGDVQIYSPESVHLEDYWMDKYEVTNKQFKEFVTKGGYENRTYWRQEFIKDGRVLSWQEAMTEFHDATGRPGPSTWELGDYPPGHDDLPVEGVSWYEALAYAEFAHKQIPTTYHWLRAADIGIYSDPLLFSHFASSNAVRVGSRPSLGPFGTYDLAGNVKEWTFNAAGSRRYILGGGWNETSTHYADLDALSPFDRSPANGFRCVKHTGGALSPVVTQPIDKATRDHRTEKPVSNAVFRVLQNFYSYDHTDLKAATELIGESSPYWRTEKITFDAAYDRQRVTAFLYLPKNAKPPYQTVIYHPPSSAYLMSGVTGAEIKQFDFLVKTGRAVLLPVYQGTYGRAANPPGPHSQRDAVIQQSKDMQRAIDYLQTRSDIACDRLGYFGISNGARLGFILLAQETRIRAAVLSEGGLSGEKKPPEIDEINFVPRVRIPVLMVNGRNDFFHPVETDQIPTFQLLGTPEKDKRHVLLDTGHVILQPQLFVKEALDWFDHYLGPVSR